mmetsp:Transcript_100983/g.253155  ORF Transcript_100983/g.253155 Transcript_100983/m.253155 type:complete len:238 (-) Transcript_100983:2183-2896(-)
MLVGTSSPKMTLTFVRLDIRIVGLTKSNLRTGGISKSGNFFHSLLNLHMLGTLQKHMSSHPQGDSCKLLRVTSAEYSTVSIKCATPLSHSCMSVGEISLPESASETIPVKLIETCWLCLVMYPERKEMTWSLAREESPINRSITLTEVSVHVLGCFSLRKHVQVPLPDHSGTGSSSSSQDVCDTWRLVSHQFRAQSKGFRSVEGSWQTSCSAVGSVNFELKVLPIDSKSSLTFAPRF